MNVSQFRTDLPEFADGTRFPDAQLTFWSGIGEKLISADRFDTLYVNAVELFTAHNLTLAIANKETVAAGGLPGGASGVIAGKTVGSISVNYDNSATMALNAGHWNQTTYGRQYIQLARLIGGGCLQL